MSKYPDCFPEDFEEKILPKTVEYRAHHVYRAAKYGAKHPDSWLSSFEEIITGKKPSRRSIDLTDPSIYSVSCSYNLDRIRDFLSHTMRDCPQGVAVKGITDPSCGPTYLTEKTGHVDWWVYKDAQPWLFFEEVKDDE